MNKENLHKIIFLVSFWILVSLFFIFYDWAIIFFDPAVNNLNQVPDYDL